VEAESQFNALLVDDGERFSSSPAFAGWGHRDCRVCPGCVGAARRRPGENRRLASVERRRKDWSVKRPATEPSGWYFEFANEFYPDIDDSAMVLLALAGARASNPDAQEACAQRAMQWLLSMQSKDGGWAAFDVDNNWHALSEVPFADHNAMLDPTCPDITGRVLEALCSGVIDRSGVRRGVGVPAADAGSRRKLVRALGSRLHLRDVSGAAWIAGGG
jgi:squalene-hopene/tetraprenyl-beta-curcumene cyclase